MIVGFTGMRDGMSECQKDQLALMLMAFRNGRRDEFIHGAAVGADTQAAVIAEQVGFTIIAIPAGGDPLARNREIVALCNVLIAAPKRDEEEQRSGTWATIRYARHAGIPVVMLSRWNRETARPKFSRREVRT